MTVSRVLNTPDLVAPTTREKVQATIRDLDYLLNDLAGPLGKPRRPFISILALHVATTPYSVSITFAIEQVAANMVGEPTSSIPFPIIRLQTPSMRFFP
jgi:DNA-binding LacI/PurR family transcriptional regulator